MRSVDVVLPASMCAMIPMLRVSSSLNALAMIVLYKTPGFIKLPAIVRESLVSFGHAVHIFLLLYGTAARISRVDHLVGELVDHGLAGAFPGILQKPANRERLPPERIDFHGHLIVRATNAPGLHFHNRLKIFDGLLENLEGIVAGLLGNLIHGAIKHALGRALLAFPHHRANELLHQIAGVDRIGGLRAAAN